jgi:nucleoside-diphosphate-sugar epimerase
LSLNDNINCIILRPSNVYGPFQNMRKPQGIIGFAVNSVINDIPLILYNNGAQIRDFIHVNDLCISIKNIIINNTFNYKSVTYNLSSSIPTTILEIIKIVEQIAKKKIILIHKPARPVDSNYAVLDNTKFCNDYNWKCNIQIEEGIENLFNNIDLNLY